MAGCRSLGKDPELGVSSEDAAMVRGGAEWSQSGEPACSRDVQQLPWRALHTCRHLQRKSLPPPSNVWDSHSAKFSWERCEPGSKGLVGTCALKP